MNKNTGLILGAFLLGGVLGKNIPITNTNSNGNTITISQEIPEKVGIFHEKQEKTGKNRNFKEININTCDVATLKSLPGIGDKKAREIISKREFTSTYQLLEDKLVGVETFEKIKDSITVGD